MTSAVVMMFLACAGGAAECEVVSARAERFASLASCAGATGQVFAQAAARGGDPSRLTPLCAPLDSFCAARPSGRAGRVVALLCDET